MSETDEFTVQRYRAILERATSLEYQIVPFRECNAVIDELTLLLRHDLDHSLGPAIIMAELEADLKISSTYFVQIACEFYNLLAPHGRSTIRRLADLGHEIGLHYEAERYLGDDGRVKLRADIRMLQDLSGQPVVSAAQHLPIDSVHVSVAPEIRNEAYEPRFTQGDLTYLSDSLMTWRQARPEELLERRQSFQFLTHPENWTEPGGCIETVLDELMRAELMQTRRRYDEVKDYYQHLLETREDRDRQFRQRQNATEMR